MPLPIHILKQLMTGCWMFNKQIFASFHHQMLWLLPCLAHTRTDQSGFFSSYSLVRFLSTPPDTVALSQHTIFSSLPHTIHGRFLCRHPSLLTGWQPLWLLTPEKTIRLCHCGNKMDTHPACGTSMGVDHTRSASVSSSKLPQFSIALLRRWHQAVPFDLPRTTTQNSLDICKDAGPATLTQPCYKWALGFFELTKPFITTLTSTFSNGCADKCGKAASNCPKCGGTSGLQPKQVRVTPLATCSCLH